MPVGQTLVGWRAAGVELVRGLGLRVSDLEAWGGGTECPGLEGDLGSGWVLQ